MRDFAERDYEQWLDTLRDAESLLPWDSPTREELTRIRERVEAIRREWRARALAPQFDLFLEVAARPLVGAVDDLQKEIEAQLDQREFLLVDEGDVPDRYRRHVANYFRDLAEAEALE